MDLSKTLSDVHLFSSIFSCNDVLDSALLAPTHCKQYLTPSALEILHILLTWICEYCSNILCSIQAFFPWTLCAGKWQRSKYVGVSVVDKTLAVMGFGKVGSEVGRRAKGLGMHVIAHDPYASAERARALGVELVSFDEALGRADFISLHMPLTPTTDKIFNDESFKKCKKGVRIVNVARGGVIDEDALVRALDSGIVAQVRTISFASLSLARCGLSIQCWGFSGSLHHLFMIVGDRRACCGLESRICTASWT